MTDNDEHILKAAMANVEAAMELDPPFSAPEKAKEPRQTLPDTSKLLDTADKLLRSQQARMARERASYETRRTELTNYYRGEVVRLEDEAEAELLALAKKWHETESETLLLIGKLKALRAV